MKWTFFTHRYPILTKNQATWYIPSPQKNKMITGQWQTKENVGQSVSMRVSLLWKFLQTIDLDNEARDWMVIWGIAIGMTSWFGTDLLPPRGAGNYRDSGYIFPGLLLEECWWHDFLNFLDIVGPPWEGRTPIEHVSWMCACVWWPYVQPLWIIFLTSWLSIIFSLNNTWNIWWVH